MTSKFLCGLLLFISAPFIVSAQQNTKSENEQQPIDKDIYHGYLVNGMAYYVRKNVSPGKRAVMYLVERAGSLQEDDDQLGIAHFVEHMAFKGTRTFPKDELISYLQKSGVKFGADVNAHTGFNQTTFELTLPTDSMQVFNKGLDILTDWASFITFDPAEIDKERSVILEESRVREKTASGRLFNQTMALEYNDSRFAQRFPIGKEDIIKNVKPETIKNFYHDWYRPDEQAIIVVGDFNPEKVVELIKEKFSVLQNPQTEREVKEYTIPPVSGTRVKILTDKESPATLFTMTVRLPGTKERTNGEYLQTLRTFLLDYMLNNRIAEITKKGNPPFLGATAFVGSSLGNTNLFTTKIAAKPGELENSVKTIVAELERARKFGFTEGEFRTAKEWYLRGRAGSYYDMQNHPSSSYADEYKRNFLNQEGIPGLEFEYKFTTKNIDKIKLSEINDLMEPYMTDQNRLILLEAPEKDSATLPDEKTLLSWVDHSGGDVSAYQGVQVDRNEDLLPGGLKSGKIESDVSDQFIDTETITLSNGAKVILKNTNFHNGQILFEAYGYGGTSLASDADYTSASLAGGLISKSGVANFSRIELDKILNNKSIGVYPYMTDYLQGIRGGASQSNFETALKLLHLYFTAPRKDSAVWAGLISQQEALLATKTNLPLNVFGDTARAVMHNYNFRANDATEPMLNSANIDKAFNYYKDRFADASNFTFVFVGSIDDVGIRSLIKKYIGSLPGTHNTQTYKDLNLNPASGRITKIIHKGIDDKSTVELLFHGAFEYNENNNLQINALGEILQIKIIERLRQQEGGTYSPKAGAYYINYPNGQYGVAVQFTCSSANVNKLIDATMDEVNKIKQNGASLSDIQKFTADETRLFQLKLKENSFWVEHLSSTSKNKEDPDYIVSYIPSLKNVTVESTKATANKYLSDNNLIKLVLLPEK